MTLRKLLSPAALALLAACSADPVGSAAPLAVGASANAAPADDSGQLGSGNLTETDAAMPQIGSGAAHDAGPHISGGGGFAPADEDDSGQLGSGSLSETGAAAPQLGSGAAHDGPHIGSGGFAPEDSAATLSAGPAFGSGAGFVQPPADAQADSIGG